MKAVFSRALRKEFNARIAGIAPEFRKSSSEFGGVVYRRRVGEKLYAFVFLLPSPQLERFTLELAVSPRDSFPFEILPGNRGPSGEIRHRIRALTGMKGDGWWYVDESRTPALQESMGSPTDIPQALAKIPALVDDACRKLELAIPMLLQRSTS